VEMKTRLITARYLVPGPQAPGFRGKTGRPMRARKGEYPMPRRRSGLSLACPDARGLFYPTPHTLHLSVVIVVTP